MPGKGYPLRIECPDCEGVGCEKCGNDGHFYISDCPKKEIDRNTLDLIRFSELAKANNWPCSGGMLSQSINFLTAHEYYTSERNKVDAELLK